jgi:hypothetical protein
MTPIVSAMGTDKIMIMSHYEQCHGVATKESRLQKSLGDTSIREMKFLVS